MLEKRNDIKKILTLVIFVTLLVITFFLLKPFIPAILFAIVLAFILFPLNKRLKKIIRNPTASAAIITFIFIVTIAVLIWLIAQIAIKEAFNLYLILQKIDIYGTINEMFSTLFADSPEMSRQIALTITQGISQLTSGFMNSAGSIITNAPTMFIQLFVAFFVSFYFLRDGEKIIKFIYDSLPFEKNIRKRFLKRSREVMNATIFGQVVIGLVQGITAGIAFYIFGAPSPLFFTILAVFLAILPFVGAWLVWLPVGLAMIATGNVLNGILLMVYGLIIVGLIDDVVRPYIVGKKGKINPVIALIGMLGGLTLMGPVGLIIGPIILEYVLIFIQLYRKGGFNP